MAPSSQCTFDQVGDELSCRYLKWPLLYIWLSFASLEGILWSFTRFICHICFHFWLYWLNFEWFPPPHKNSACHMCVLNCFDVYSSTRTSPLGWKTLFGRLGKRSKRRMLHKVRFSFQVLYVGEAFVNFGCKCKTILWIFFCSLRMIICFCVIFFSYKMGWDSNI